MLTFLKCTSKHDRKLLTSNSKNSDGGRVTEICARPLINLLYPDLAGFIQPLSGEYGGYTNILKNVKYSSGYGVEMKLLIEILNLYGIDCMGQVNLYSKEHDHQPLNALTKMGYTIMKTMLKDHLKIHNTNDTLLIKNVEPNKKDENIKIRSEEHEHCNAGGRVMNNNHFKYIQSNDIELDSINSIIDAKNNLNNVYNI